MAQTLADVESAAVAHLQVRDPALSAFFPRGLRRGHKILVSGGPGAGKSTLLAQLTRWQDPAQTLWITCDETPDIVLQRAQRFNGEETRIEVAPLKDLSVGRAVRLIAERAPTIVVLDGLAVRRPADAALASALLSDSDKRYVLFLSSSEPLGTPKLQHRVHTAMRVERGTVTVQKNRLGPASP